MRILITNDDGINGEGLLTLARWARRLGEVTVVAPKVEQSGKSHGIEIIKAFEVKETRIDGDIRAFSVDSTPADCVRFAVLGMGEKYDLVFSGINSGLNIGLDIVYSGTVGAVYEAATLGMNAVAVSTCRSTFAPALGSLDRICNYFVDNALLSKNIAYNVNIPKEAGDIRITRQGRKYYSDDFVPQGDDMYKPVGKCIYEEADDFSIDTHAAMHGFISITPLSLERTNLEVFDALRS